MTRVGDYAFINAKVRAMRSRMLTDAQIEELLAAQNLEGAVLALRETSYARVADDLAAGRDLRQAQLALEEEEIDLHLRLAGLLSGRPRAVVEHLVTAYEIENLKVVLRLWHRSLPMESAYLLREHVIHKLPLAELMVADNIQAVARLLEKTPYGKPVLAAADEFVRTHALFPVETSLSETYFRDLLRVVGRLPAIDRDRALRIVGGEIDVWNLNWVLSCKLYYRLPQVEMSRHLIPDGSRVLPDQAARIYRADKLQNVLAEVVDLPEGATAGLTGLDDAAAGVLLVAMVNELLVQEVRRILAGFPFTIGTVLGFLVLKRLETRNLITLLECAVWGEVPESRRHRLIRPEGVV